MPFYFSASPKLVDEDSYRFLIRNPKKYAKFIIQYASIDPEGEDTCAVGGTCVIPLGTGIDLRTREGRAKNKRLEWQVEHWSLGTDTLALERKLRQDKKKLGWKEPSEK